jgi:hypothetical protein
MGDLEEKYTALVPAQIRDLVVEKKLSLVIDGDIKLIKDRSAMADESTYLPGVQCAVGTAVIKLAIKELFETGRKFEGWPDDYLSNLRYAYVYDGEEGERIVDIARQLNGGQELSVEDLQFLSVEGNDLTSRLARLAVLTNIQVVGDNGVAVETSLATKRAQVMAEAASHSELASVRKKLEAEREMVGQFGVRTLDGDDVDSVLDQSADSVARLFSAQLNAPEAILPADSSISETERNNFSVLVRNIESVYGAEVRVNIDSETSRGGLSKGSDIYLSRDLLRAPKSMIETAVHELAHFQEGTGGHDRNFTHQADGSFGREYKDVVHKLLRTFMNRDSRTAKLPLAA